MLENWTLGPKAMLPSVTERHLNLPVSFMGVKMAFLRGPVWKEQKFAQNTESISISQLKMYIDTPWL